MRTDIRSRLIRAAVAAWRGGGLALLVGLGACAKPGDAVQSGGGADGPVMKVRTVVVRVQELPSEVEVTGTVRPVQRAQLGAKIMGAIEELPIALGQRVKQGDVLAQIAAGEINARVAQARAHLSSATRDLEREKGLLATGASTSQVVKDLEDRVTASQAQLREAEVLLSYAIIRAPFDGVIARKWVNAGDLAAAGTPLLEVEGTSHFEVEAGVPESLTSNLKVGSSVAVVVPSSSVRFVGAVAEISSAADPQARTVLVKIAVPDSVVVRSGQFTRVAIPGEPRRVLEVPQSAVTRFGQMEQIFLVRPDGRASMRLVKIAEARDGRVEVLAGISEGDRVIVSAPANLSDGARTEAVDE